MAEIKVIAKLKPMGKGFKLVDAEDVELNGKGVDEVINGKEDDIKHFRTWAEYEAAKNTIRAGAMFVVDEDNPENQIPKHNLLEGRDEANAHPYTAIEGLQAELDKKTDLTKTQVLESRMNQFAKLPEGSTAGDAELADIRVGADGKTYENAGEAVRTQFSGLKETIDGFAKVIHGEFPSNNIVHTDYVLEEGKTYSIYYRGADANIFSRVDSNNYIKVKSEGYYILTANQNDTLSIVKTGNTSTKYYIAVAENEMLVDYIQLRNNVEERKSDSESFYGWHLGGYNFSSRSETSAANAIVSRDIVVNKDTNIYIRVLNPTGFIGYVGKNGATPQEFRGGRIVYKFEKGNTYRICFFNTTLESLSDDFREILSVLDIRYDALGAERTDHFRIRVSCAIDRLDDIMDFQSNPHLAYDNALIMLPKSYTEHGKKTRLVVFPHGAGGDITVNDSIVERTLMAKYLVANGYAVMDTNGLPESFAQQYGYNINNNIGSWLAMRCYSIAYSYCMSHYNLYPDVFMFGESMGGLTAANLAASGMIPIKAVALACPVLDTYNNIWLHPWSGGAPKANMIKFYEFTKDSSGEYAYDESKLTGFNPMTNNTVTVADKKYTSFPCPLKIWHCKDDDVVDYSTSVRYTEQVKNNGGYVRLRPFNHGGHGPMGAGNVVTATYGFKDYKEETLTIRAAVEEVFIWFAMYDDINL